MALLIKNVSVPVASERFAERVDILVIGNKIAAIGPVSDATADEIIDGLGAYVVPGFIDIDSASDHYLTLFDNPTQGDFVRQGVTTIIGGNCGSSLAPLLYGGLESVRKWTDTDAVNVDWHTVEELLSHFERRPLGVNFGTLSGHSTIRRALVGDANRALTKNEIAVFEKTLRGSLSQGSFGLSTGLAYAHSRETPYQELAALLKAVRKEGGIYTTHVRDMRSGIVSSVEEALSLARETGVPTVISHLSPFVGYESKYEAALERIEQASTSEEVYFDIYPYDTSVSPLYTFLPVWAQKGGLEEMKKIVTDTWMESRIAKDMEHPHPEDIMVAWAHSDETLQGKTLRNLMDLYELPDARQALIRLMRVTKLRASLFYKNINMETVKKAIKSPRALISSNSASFSRSRQDESHARATSTYPTYLALMKNTGSFMAEEIFEKLSRIPARLLGLARRGDIAVGNAADLVCVQNGDIKCTVVNGVVAYRDGEVRGTLKGTPLRHGRES